LAFFAACNALMPGVLELTYTISDVSAIFLDMVIFRGEGWHNTGKLDMKCYQKPVNKYLYIPFCRVG
jgi:hypothetical protein